MTTCGPSPKSPASGPGFQLYLVQSGKEPPYWKPMTAIGPRCREIRVRDASGAYRVFYVATLGNTVYVLHCFQKKSQRTAQEDIELGKERYKQMIKLNATKGKP